MMSAKDKHKAEEIEPDLDDDNASKIDTQPQVGEGYRSTITTPQVCSHGTRNAHDQHKYHQLAASNSEYYRTEREITQQA